MNTYEFFTSKADEVIIAWRVTFRGFRKIFSTKKKAQDFIDSALINIDGAEIYEFFLEQINVAKEIGFEHLKHVDLF